MLIGRTAYEGSRDSGRAVITPWEEGLNRMPKHVFSSALQEAMWSNSTVVRRNLAEEVERLKQARGGVLIWGLGVLAEALLKHKLIDVIDISVHPIMLGRRKLPLRSNQNLRLRLIAAKTFARGIVTLTYEPDHG
jgi:dihydrofolate reductase